MRESKKEPLPNESDVLRRLRRMSDAQRLAYLHQVHQAGYEAGFREGSRLRGELDKIKDVVSGLGTGKENGSCL